MMAATLSPAEDKLFEVLERHQPLWRALMTQCDRAVTFPQDDITELLMLLEESADMCLALAHRWIRQCLREGIRRQRMRLRMLKGLPAPDWEPLVLKAERMTGRLRQLEQRLRFESASDDSSTHAHSLLWS